MPLRLHLLYRYWLLGRTMASSQDQDRATPEWADTDTDVTEDMDDVEFEVRCWRIGNGALHVNRARKLMDTV